VIRRILLIAVSFAALSHPAGASEVESRLLAWAGKYPVPKVGKSTFFEEPEIRKTLSHLTSVDRRRLLTTFAVESPIELIQGFLVSHRCKPHWCPNENVVVVVRPADLAVLVFFYDSGKDLTRCFSTGAPPSALPDPVKESILESHIPKFRDSDNLVEKNQWFDQLSCKVLSRS